MSKGLLNSMVLKNLFEDVDGAELLPSLIESGVITKEQVEEYYKANIKSQKVSKPTYSLIENGVLVKFDERDLDKNGGYVTPKGVVTIGKSAFEKCFDLMKIHLSRDIVEIESRAFNECRNLKIVTMTNSVMNIGPYAFASCTSLPALKLSENLTNIPMFAFANCTSLQGIILPKKNQMIHDYAFGHCENLTTISSPTENLLWVHPDAFSGAPIQRDFMRIFKEKQEEQKQEKGTTK